MSRILTPRDRSLIGTMPKVVPLSSDVVRVSVSSSFLNLDFGISHVALAKALINVDFPVLVRPAV